MGKRHAACLPFDKPRLAYDYFKQLFAQVTIFPIDSIREENIMSLEVPSARSRISSMRPSVIATVFTFRCPCSPTKSSQA